MSQTTPAQRRYVTQMLERSGKPVVYANQAMLDISPFEAIISFGMMDAAAAPQPRGGDEGDVVVEAATVARIALPHRVFVALSEAMVRMIEERPEMRDGASGTEV